MADETDRNRYDRMVGRAEILIPAIRRMLEIGRHEEVAATLRLHADPVEGKTDPAEEADKREMAEEIAKAFAEERVPVKYHHH